MFGLWWSWKVPPHPMRGSWGGGGGGSKPKGSGPTLWVCMRVWVLQGSVGLGAPTNNDDNNCKHACGGNPRHCSNPCCIACIMFPHAHPILREWRATHAIYPSDRLENFMGRVSETFINLALSQRWSRRLRKASAVPHCAARPAPAPIALARRRRNAATGHNGTTPWGVHRGANSPVHWGRRSKTGSKT